MCSSKEKENEQNGRISHKKRRLILLGQFQEGFQREMSGDHSGGEEGVELKENPESVRANPGARYRFHKAGGFVLFWEDVPCHD